MKSSFDISIVVPLYNEEESLPELCSWVEKVMLDHRFSYEILLVDDGSTDSSWKVIEELSGVNPHIKGIRFNSNCGKSAALHMGFHACKGSVVITLDADLQDSPDEIPGLYKMIKEEGYDLVSGWKKKRYDPLSKTLPTKLFNAVTRSLSGIQLHDFNCGLKAYKLRVVKSIDIYGEMHRYIPVIAKWKGFKKIGERVVVHQARKYGVTKFGGWERFIYGFLDLISISFVTKFGKRPMHFFGTMGTLSFLSGFSIAAWLIAEKLILLSRGIKPRDVTSQPLFFLAIVALIVGVQMFLTGFLGELSNNYSGKKNDYVIAERIGFTSLVE
jgi:glycosyltransferase involved in cell wall biosynthesis